MRYAFFTACFVLAFAGVRGHDVSAADGSSAASKYSTQELTPEQISRGQPIQRMLRAAIDYSGEHGGWPKDLGELKTENETMVKYLGPPVALDGVERHVRSQLRAVMAVCHEPLESHKDGAWVGFADGHVEFVTDAKTLQDALDQFTSARPRIEANAASSAAVAAAKIKPDATAIIRLVDEAGKPVAGAQIGTYQAHSDNTPTKARGELFTKLGNALAARENTSDASGKIIARYDWLFYAEYARPEALIALQPDRDLVAIQKIEPSLFAAKADGSPQELVMTLHRGVPVRGSLSRIGAMPKYDEFVWSNTYVCSLDGANLRPMSSTSRHLSFDFLLPPGEYLIDSYGVDTYDAFRYLRVTEDMQSCDLQIDLPPARIAELREKPAPELRGIKAWKNDQSTSLENLRGKWVLLDFWGYWCGPCVGAMPDLMQLYDDFGDKGLVAIAVHDDSVASIEEMDQKLEAVKKERWKDRDLPFFVALDGGGELPIAGTERSVKGATHAAYGVQSWPTTVLIDPNGVVVGERDAHSPELRKFLEEKLKSRR